MEILNTYGFIIAACLVIIISYFFNHIAQRTSIPSVLLLIFMGIMIEEINVITHIAPGLNLFPVLEVLGIVGLIMIVLEAALELCLTKEKLGFILKSLAIAFISLCVNSFLIAWLIKTIWTMEWFIAFIYATPLSIISSAIIIPSVKVLPGDKKEFLIYESTFSDILGIMLFYFLIEAGGKSGGELALGITGSILITISVSIIVGYGLLYIFQKIKGGTKLFLMISVLVLLYSTGKLFHLSSLLLILVFGLLLSNYRFFTGGRLKQYFDHTALRKIYEDFNLITIESSFVVRTFFFIVFGMTIRLSSILDSRVIMVSLGILAAIYISRYIIINIFFRKFSYPEWQIAPRGLITILLFFSIPQEYHIDDFADFEGVLLLVILVSSGIMAASIISYRNNKSGNERLIAEIQKEPDCADKSMGGVDNE